MQIHSCVRYGDVEGVRLRLERGIPVDLKDEREGYTPLMVAAESKKAGVDMLRLLVEYGADVNIVASTLEYTPLAFAIKSGSVQKVRYLLDTGAEVYFRNRFSIAPVDYALGIREPTRNEILKLLIDAGANLNRLKASNLSFLATFGGTATLNLLREAGVDTSPLRTSPLVYAIQFGSVEDVAAELAKGEDVKANSGRWTAWQECLMHGDVRKAELLLEHGAEIEGGDLRWAVVEDNAEMVKWLLSCGHDPNARDEYQSTPLHQASEIGSTECVRVLIEAGADVNADDHVQSKPISVAANPEIVRLLKDAGADINYVDGQGYSRLKSAAETGEVEIVRALLDLGVDTEADNKRYTTTALHVAVRDDDLEIVKMLLDAGANPNSQSGDYWFPMMNVPSIEMAKLLLDAGANINLTTQLGSDALHYVKDPEVAAYLIERGARVNPPDTTY